MKDDSTDIFTNKFFAYNPRVISCVEKILKIKRFPRNYINFPNYPYVIGKNHGFRIASSNSCKEYRKEIPESSLILLEHLFKKKIIETFGVDVQLYEVEPQKRYKFCYVDERKDNPGLRSVTKFNPGWWDINSQFMDWEWFISSMVKIADKFN